MIKMTLSKIRKICSVALIPRILRDEFSLTPRKIGKRPLDGYWKMNKSTDSKDKDAECEKCKKLIEMVFGPEKTDPILKQVETNLDDMPMDKVQKAITPSLLMEGKPKEISEQESAQKELKPIYGNLESASEPQQKPIDNILQSTTAKEDKEELAQKLETIVEPGMVEAGAPKVEGFNTPKVLGNQETIFDGKSHCTKVGLEEDPMDTIAKKCLGSPPDKIDERIMEELKRCGMLGKGRRRPGSRRNNRPGKKEQLMEAKAEECMLYFEKTKTPANPIQTSSLTHYQNTQDHLRNVCSAYFKNVPTQSIVEADSKEKENKNIYLFQEQEKAKQLSTDNQATDASGLNSPTITNKPQVKEDVVLEEPFAQQEILKSITNEEQNLQKPVETIEVETEEVRVSAAETCRLGMPKSTESENNDSKLLEPEITPHNEILPEADLSVQLNNSSTIDKRQSTTVAFSDLNDPSNWELGPEIENRPFNQPNTAISGTLPYPEMGPDPESKDTAISAWQNPSEFYELSHCDLEKLDEYAIKPSTIRSLEAYHPYTFISSAQELKTQENILLTSKEPLKEASEEPPQNKDLGINKDISATMGPLPQLKDMEEELSLTEMLKRVRERNRLQYCRECEYKAVEVEPVEASKCPPPLDRGPTKTLGPGPCKPKPKPCDPPPPKCPPSPCPPPSPPCKPKDPCAKFTRNTLIGDRIKEAFTLVLQVGLRSASTLPILCYENNFYATEPLKQLIAEDVYRVEKLASFLLSNPAENTKDSSKEDVIFARDFEPWTPVPCWPIPKKEKKQPFVCPKEGCKIIPPPRLNPPCKENPCINLPKRSFSAIDIEYEPLYLYEDEF